MLHFTVHLLEMEEEASVSTSFQLIKIRTPCLVSFTILTVYSLIVKSLVAVEMEMKEQQVLIELLKEETTLDLLDWVYSVMLKVDLIVLEEVIPYLDRSSSTMNLYLAIQLISLQVQVVDLVTVQTIRWSLLLLDL